MAAAAARALPKSGKSSLPLFLRSRISPKSKIDLNLNSLPKDPQFIQSLLFSNQNLQTQKPLFDSPQLGGAFAQFTAAQGAESREITNRDGVYVDDSDDDFDILDYSDDDFDDIDDEDLDFDDDSDEEEDDCIKKKKKILKLPLPRNLGRAGATPYHIHPSPSPIFPIPKMADLNLNRKYREDEDLPLTLNLSSTPSSAETKQTPSKQPPRSSAFQSISGGDSRISVA